MYCSLSNLLVGEDRITTVHIHDTSRIQVPVWYRLHLALGIRSRILKRGSLLGGSGIREILLIVRDQLLKSHLLQC